MKALILVILGACAARAEAQVHTGRIDVEIADLTGAALPGAAVEISGTQQHSTVTDARGEAHFLNLAPGPYTVRAKHAGFSDYLNWNVVVGAGRSVPLKVTMTVQGVQTQVQVIVDVPTVDPRKMDASTNVILDELQGVPSARDPWVVLQTVPAVAVDRVNVGGAESGQQSTFIAKGATVADNTWNVDGITITDVAATGSTPVYYDFDMLQEIQAVTGGADVQIATPGVQLSLVLKAATNTPRGSGRVYVETEALQANNMPADLSSTIGGTTGKGNRTHRYRDYGVEFGGPLMKDRVWAWGAAGKTHIDLITLNGAHDRTELRDDSVKVTGQLTRELRGNFTFFRGDKQKFGRGAAPDRAPETTYDQSGATDLYKGEAAYAGHGLFATAKAAHVSGGFSLTPEGGTRASIFRGDDGVYHNSFDLYRTRRPQNSAAADASAFRGGNELKFGLAWRRVEANTTDSYPGTGIITYHIGYPEMIAQVTRDYALLTNATYAGAYVGDAWTHDRLTVSGGLRWDRQSSSLGATAVPASKALPSLLPAVTATPVNDAIVWSSVTPRVGATWAFGENRRTIARATYARFASQLGAADAGVISTIQRASISFLAIDRNANLVADVDELGPVIGSASGFDASNPTRLTTVNRIGSYRTPATHEITFGGDHEIFAHFSVSAALTYRYVTHVNWTPRIGVTSADYMADGTLSGNVSPVGSFSVPLYALPASKVPVGGGVSYEERRGYHQRFVGVEASATKRMSDKWMLRAAFSYNDHREYFGRPSALEDPTPSPVSPATNGGLVVTETAGSGKSSVFMILPSFQFAGTGLYQWWWGINVGWNVLIRQGYAEPFFRSAVPTDDGANPLKDVLVVGDVGRFRLPTVKSADARLEKTFALPRARVAVDLDVFNFTNRGTPLGRQYDIRLQGVSTGFNSILEIMNPLIVRVGTRVTF